MTFSGIQGHLLQAFSDVICHTDVQQFTRFQLSRGSSVIAELIGLCVMSVSTELYLCKLILNAFLLQQVTQIDSDLKVKSQAYNSLKGNLQNLERKATYVLL